MRVHDAAFIGLIEGDTQLADRTFEGTVTERPAYYVSVFPNSGQREQSRATGPQSDIDSEYIVHSVGSSPEQAKAVNERVFTRVLGQIPSVAGFKCRRIRHVTTQPLQIDRDLDPPLWFLVDVFAFESEPA